MFNGRSSIVFEGGDGCGKTTIVNLLKEYLAQHEVPNAFFREPGGTKIGEEIRETILNKENTQMSSLCEALLFAAAREQNMKENILPALAAKKFVVLDRFVESSYVYQGVGRGLGMDTIIGINSPVLAGWEPDMTIFLDITPEKAISRIMANSLREVNRLDLEKMDFMKKIREGYLQRAVDNKHYVVVNADQDIEKVFADVLYVLSN